MNGIPLETLPVFQIPPALPPSTSSMLSEYTMSTYTYRAMQQCKQLWAKCRLGIVFPKRVKKYLWDGKP